ncbi:MAG: hypothetical protein ACYTG6_03575, partial [Planctomycetota bacterium]
LDGDHHFVALNGNIVPPEEFRGSTGTVTFDGAGTVDLVSIDNDDGVVTGPNLSSGSSYTVYGDRTFLVDTVPGGDRLIGGVSSGGDIVIGGMISDGLDPSVFATLEVAGTHDDTSMQGDWFLAGFLRDPGSGTNQTFTGTASFDGAGGYTISTIDNEEGVISGPNASGGIYTVAPDGSLTVFNSLGEPIEGGVSAGDDVAVLGGFTTNGAPPAVAFLVRKAGAFDTSSFSGRYFFIAFRYDVGDGYYVSTTGLAAFDGAGALTIATYDNENGVVTGPTLDGALYSVAGDGTLTIDTPGGDVLQGGVLAGGEIGIIGGAVAPVVGTEPILVLLVKQSPQRKLSRGALKLLEARAGG